MAFTDEEKVDIRRFCGYPAFGKKASQAFYFRFSQYYGRLEWLMNNLSSAEESVIRDILTDIRQLYADMVDVRENLDTNVAAVWKRNTNELVDRYRLYTFKRLEMCAVFGIPYRGGSIDSLRLLV